MTRRLDRWLDIFIRLASAIAVVLVAYIGYAYWTSERTMEVSSPAGRAIENLSAVVQAGPTNPIARLRLAEALAYAGRLDEAIEQYEAVLELEKDYIPALNGLATVAMKRQEYDTAESYWKKIINMLDTSANLNPDPRLEAAYYGLGVTYVDMKRYEEAVTSLRQAARINKSASDTHYMLSVAYRELGYADKQRDELDITLAFDPYSAQANYDLGLLLLKSGDTAAAAECFRISVDNAPDEISLPQSQLEKLAAQGSAKARLTTATALKETDAGKALSEARIAAALDPGSVEAVRLVAVLWEEKGDATRALNAYRRLAELLPQDAVTAEAIKRLTTNAQ